MRGVACGPHQHYRAATATYHLSPSVLINQNYKPSEVRLLVFTPGRYTHRKLDTPHLLQQLTESAQINAPPLPLAPSQLASMLIHCSSWIFSLSVNISETNTLHPLIFLPFWKIL